MINQNLHRQPVPLDSVQHRQLALQLPVTDWSVGNRLNAVFVAASEFGDVCREFPIVFVRAGKGADGLDEVAPIAVLGLAQEQNLFLEHGAWRAQYMPAVLRFYPFCIGRIDEQKFAICVDLAWAGSQPGAGGGVRLFDDQGQPTEALTSARTQMELLEGEVQRTRQACRRLVELDVLRDMRFDATLPGGAKHSVDGFLTVDEQLIQKLPDATVGELHRQGLLGLIHLHWVSLGNMRRLVEWYATRPATAANGSTGDATATAGAPADAPAAVPGTVVPAAG